MWSPRRVAGCWSWRAGFAAAWWPGWVCGCGRVPVVQVGCGLPVTPASLGYQPVAKPGAGTCDLRSLCVASSTPVSIRAVEAVTAGPRAARSVHPSLASGCRAARRRGSAGRRGSAVAALACPRRGVRPCPPGGPALALWAAPCRASALAAPLGAGPCSAGAALWRLSSCWALGWRALVPAPALPPACPRVLPCGCASRRRPSAAPRAAVSRRALARRSRLGAVGRAAAARAVGRRGGPPRPRARPGGRPRARGAGGGSLR